MIYTEEYIIDKWVNNNLEIWIDEKNPKTPGSKTYNKYEKYKYSKTIGEFKKNKGWKEDFKSAIKNGSLKIICNNDIIETNSDKSLSYDIIDDNNEMDNIITEFDKQNYINLINTLNINILKSLIKCSNGILLEYLKDINEEDINGEEINEEDINEEEINEEEINEEDINEEEINEGDINEEDINEEDIENNINLLPIVKWSGGKKDEISKFIDLIPSYNLYIEPFIGGGSLYFHLNPKKAVIADVHKELISFYNSIKKGHSDDIYEFMENNPNEEKRYQ